VSAPAAVTLRRQGAPDLLVAYADAVAALPIGPMAGGCGVTPPGGCWPPIRSWRRG
jgi:hypothetical protein